MIQRTWKAALAGVCLIVLNVPGPVAAMAPGEAAPPVAKPGAEVAGLLALVDAEAMGVVHEMGGTLAICPACPPGENCCTASCFFSCCTAVCPPGSTPDCSCDFTTARCFCEPPPRPKCLDSAGGVADIGEMLSECLKELAAIETS